MDMQKQFPEFTSRRDKCVAVIGRAILGSVNNRISTGRAYDELRRAGLLNQEVPAEQIKARVMDYLELAGFTANRVYPNPVVADSIMMPDVLRQELLGNHIDSFRYYLSDKSLQPELQAPTA